MPRRWVRPSFPERLNRLRATVLGADDGIISVSSVLFGIAAARPAVLPVAAVVTTVAGAFSMAVGEYISVSAQVDAEHGIGQPATVHPVWAAISSASSFTAGAALPAAAMVLAPPHLRLAVTAAAVTAALACCGWLAAHLAEVSPIRPTIRVVAGGAVGLAATYCAGLLLG
jgi:vacuolar iron transporter family protein